MDLLIYIMAVLGPERARFCVPPQFPPTPGKGAFGAPTSGGAFGAPFPKYEVYEGLSTEYDVLDASEH